MASDSDESGAERLDGGDMKDYKSIDVLDRYDGEMLDDRRKVRELSAKARREAEENMAARDQREKSLRERIQQGGGSARRAPKALERLHASSAGLEEIARIGKLLKTSGTILAKAGEMLRKAFVGGRSLPASHQQCLPTACIEIASRACKRPVNRDVLSRICKQNEKDYLNTVKAMHCLLGIRRDVSVAELCAEFKCNGIKATTRQTLEVFKRQFWASLAPEKREDADFSRPVFAMAALLLTAERHKHIVKTPDRMELLKAGGDVSDEELRRVYFQMKGICTLGALSGGGGSRAEDDATGTATATATGTAQDPGLATEPGSKPAAPSNLNSNLNPGPATQLRAESTQSKPAAGTLVGQGHGQEQQKEFQGGNGQLQRECAGPEVKSSGGGLTVTDTRDEPEENMAVGREGPQASEEVGQTSTRVEEDKGEERKGQALGRADDGDGLSGEGEGEGGEKPLLAQLAAERREREQARREREEEGKEEEEEGKEEEEEGGGGAMSVVNEGAEEEGANAPVFGAPGPDKRELQQCDHGVIDERETIATGSEVSDKAAAGLQADPQAGVSEMQGGGASGTSAVTAMECEEEEEVKTPCAKHKGGDGVLSNSAEGQAARKSACKTQRKDGGGKEEGGDKEGGGKENGGGGETETVGTASSKMLTPFERRRQQKAAHSASNRLAAFTTVGALKKAKMETNSAAMQAAAQPSRPNNASQPGVVAPQRAALQPSSSEVLVVVNDGKPAAAPGKKRKQPDPEEEALKKREYELWKATVRGGNSGGNVAGNTNHCNRSGDVGPNAAEAPRPSKQMSLSSFVRPAPPQPAALQTATVESEGGALL